jgi:hypothetical protein
MKQFIQGPKPRPPQMAELPSVTLLYWFIETAQQFEAVRRDARHHHPPVPAFAAAGDQTAPFQAVEKAGDVGIAGDHSAGDVAAGQSVGRTAQDAEHVVLVGGKVVLLEQCGQLAGQGVGRAQQLKEHRLLRTFPTTFALGLICNLHITNNSRYNEYCQTAILEANLASRGEGVAPAASREVAAVPSYGSFLPDRASVILRPLSTPNLSAKSS